MTPTPTPPACTSPIDWAQLIAYLDEAQTVLLITHVRSDADAIGSQKALSNILKRRGKKTILVNSEPLPDSLRFLDRQNEVRGLDELDDSERKEMESVDLLVTLDTSSWSQLGKMADVVRRFTGQKITIDHHAKGDDIGVVPFVDSTAEATGTIVCQLLIQMKECLDRETATALFASIASDTGWFRFSSVTSQTYRWASFLVDCGVIPDEIYKQIYENESFARLKLVGTALNKAEQFLDDRAIFSSLYLADFEAAGAKAFESEDIINLLLNVNDTHLAIMMMELRTGGFKLSFRSRCDLDCSQLAARFGGGGHKRAAGATVHLPGDEVRQSAMKVAAEMYQAMETDSRFL